MATQLSSNMVTNIINFADIAALMSREQATNFTSDPAYPFEHRGTMAIYLLATAHGIDQKEIRQNLSCSFSEAEFLEVTELAPLAEPHLSAYGLQ